jgi:hypothetical protein
LKSVNNQTVNFLDFRLWKGYFQTIAGFVGKNVFPALETEFSHFPTLETYFPAVLTDCDPKAVSSLRKSFSKFRDQVNSERSRFTLIQRRQAHK